MFVLQKMNTAHTHTHTHTHPDLTNHETTKQRRHSKNNIAEKKGGNEVIKWINKRVVQTTAFDDSSQDMQHTNCCLPLVTCCAFKQWPGYECTLATHVNLSPCLRGDVDRAVPNRSLFEIVRGHVYNKFYSLLKKKIRTARILLVLWLFEVSMRVSGICVMAATVLLIQCAARKKKWRHFNSTHCLDLPSCRGKPVAYTITCALLS